MQHTIPLKKNTDFRTVYKKRISKADGLFIVYIMKNETEINRLGVSVSKKVGNSVVRHKVKRLVKECYRLNEEKVYSGYDIVVVARNGAKDADFKSTKRSLFGILKRHKILKRENL